MDLSSPAYAWTADESSNQVIGIPTATGSVKTLSAGYTTGCPLSVDGQNDILLASTSAPYTPYAVAPARASVTSTAGTLASLNGAANWLLAFPGQNYASGAFAGYTTTGCSIDSVNATTDSSQATTGSSSCVTGAGDAIVAGGSAAVNNASVAPAMPLVLEPTSTNSLCWIASTNTCKPYASLNVPTAAIFDGNETLWVANNGNASIAPFTPTFTFPDPFTMTYTATAIGSGYLHGNSYGATVGTPYAIAIDGSGNVWLANAGCVANSTAHCNATSFTLSEIVGAAAPTITPRAAAAAASSANNDASLPQQ